MHYLEELYKIKERFCKELVSVINLDSEKISSDEIKMADHLSSAIKNICKIIKYEEEHGGYYGKVYNGASTDVWNRNGYYGQNHDNYYGQHHDSYYGHSGVDEGVVARLENIASEVTDSGLRQDIVRVINKIRSK